MVHALVPIQTLEVLVLQRAVPRRVEPVGLFIRQDSKSRRLERRFDAVVVYAPVLTHIFRASGQGSSPAAAAASSSTPNNTVGSPPGNKGGSNLGVGLGSCFRSHSRVAFGLQHVR